MESLSFGPFRLDRINQHLWQDETSIPLAPKTYAILELLVSSPGQPISKQQFLDTVWPEEPVGDAVLHVRIGELRRQFGDDPRNPQYIETVHRYGYRFIAPVHVLTEPVQATVSFAEPPTATSRPTPLVGRERVMTQLHEHFAHACRGERQALLVTGEAGLGKTTVIEAFVQQLPHDCWASFGQWIEHYGSGEAYLPLLEALERLRRGARGEVLLTLLRRHAPTWLAQMPSLLTAEERRELHDQLLGTTRDRMLRELAEAMEQLTTVMPLVLVLEDLHWSDPATLDFISVVARRRDPARLLLIGTYRPPDILLSDHPAKKLHQNLIARQQGHEIALASLTTDDIRAYLAARFDNIAPDVCDPLAELLYRHTEGNALFMVNCVTALVEQEVIIKDGEGWHVLYEGEVVDMHVPTALQHFIVYQAERLSPEAQRVLEAASVAGGQFVATTVAAALDMETEAIERYCDDLVRRQQFLYELEVEQWPDGTWMGCYRFAHALYREALYHRLPEASRIRYHQRIGTRLEVASGERARDIAATRRPFRAGLVVLCRDVLLPSRRRERPAAPRVTRSDRPAVQRH